MKRNKDIQPPLVALANGLELYVDDRGEGDVITLIPGWAYTADVFSRNTPVLSQHYRTIAYDPRSHGRSQVTKAGNDYLQHGCDLHYLMQALELNNVTLVGWSLGVYDALAYLQQYGFDNVRSLVMIDESPTIVKTTANDWGEGTAEEVQSLIDVVNSSSYLPFFRDYMAQGFVGDAPESLLDRFTQYAASLQPAQAAELLCDATKHDFQDIVRQASREIPVLQIVREDWAPAAQRWIAANQPTAEVQVLGGHLMLLQYAEQVNQYLLDFLGKIK